MSSRGVVRRSDGYVLTQTEQKGYLFVTLSGKLTSVHSVVLKAFVGPRPPKHVTRHLDNNPANNHLSNLVWGTQKQNIEDRTKAGNDHNANKTHCPQGHSYDDAYRYKDTNGHNRRICRTCQLERVKGRDRSATDQAYYERNKERIRQQQREYRERNKNALREKRRARK